MQNYRPICILPSLSKVLEKIIHQQLLPFLETILDPRMAAYRKGYSCQHVLLRVVEGWKLALDNRKHVAAMLMDLSKAFDSLPHELIIAKLKAYGMKEEGVLLYGPTSPNASKELNFPVVRVIGWSYSKASPRGRSWGRYSSISS